MTARDKDAIGLSKIAQTSFFLFSRFIQAADYVIRRALQQSEANRLSMSEVTLTWNAATRKEAEEIVKTVNRPEFILALRNFFTEDQKNPSFEIVDIL